jgi:transcriptional regulator with XRE-family HTH domain
MIDILKRITNQRIARNWTEYQLAVRSGLPQSTISSWFRKGLVPSVASIEKICIAFDMSLSQFFSDGTCVELDSQQAELLKKWELLTPKQKHVLLELLDSIVNTDNMIH